MRIVCAISDMQSGGAQRVLAQICNHLAGQGHDVILLSLGRQGEKPFFELSDRVQLSSVGTGPEGKGLRRLARVGRWVFALRRALAESMPDLVISFIDTTNIMVLVATLGLALPVIVSERIDPTAYAHRLGWLERSLRSLTYRRARRIVVQTRRAAQFFNRVPPGRLVTIPNPIPASSRCARPGEPGPGRRFQLIGVGRLDHQKGFDLLIDSFAGLAERFADWDVLILGEGPERAALQSRIARRGLSGRISLRPPIRDIAGEFARSHAMAFPSRYEGFPNALAEAMAAGLPAVAFDNVSGVEDLVTDGVTGILASWGDGTTDAAVRSLGQGLERLMADANLRIRLGAAAAGRITEFDAPNVLRQWDELIAAVVRGQTAEGPL